MNTVIILSNKAFILSTLEYLMIPFKSLNYSKEVVPLNNCLRFTLDSVLLKLILVLFYLNNYLILSDPF